MTNRSGESGALDSAGLNLGALFKSIEPDREAIVDLGGDRPRSFSYGRLNELCDAFARGLAATGIGAGDRTAILSLNRAEYIVAIFGALRLGAVPVLVNIKLPRETISYILKDSGAQLAFAERAFAPLSAPLPTVQFEDGFDSFLDFGSFETAPADAGQLSMLLYTSGTTGKPKGVILHHGGQHWAARALAEHRRIRAEDRILISAPFYHKNAIVAIKTALLPGACLAVLPRFDAKATIEAMEGHKLTMLTGVPTMMSLMLREPVLADANRSSVRVLSMGSSPASDKLLSDLKAAFPRAEIHLNYGSTEGGPIMFGWYHPQGLPRPLHTVGFPMPDCECKLVGGPSPNEGELWVRNSGVAKGYLNLPEATAARFEDGWYKTGDILRKDEDGWFYFVSRMDDMFVSGGENVYPQQVEALLERHPGVRQAAVIAVPHELKGTVPYAFVVPQRGAATDEALLKAFTIEHGPAYAHPRRIVFVDRLPLTGTNKIDREALRASLGGEARMSSDVKLDREALEARLLRAPFHRWLGLSVVEITAQEITLKAQWREDFVVNAEGGYTHGGILASLIDIVADFALAARLGRPFPTVDLRVDYHRPAFKGDLICKGRVLKLGAQVSSAEASIHDTNGKLLASGRGVYLTSDAK